MEPSVGKRREKPIENRAWDGLEPFEPLLMVLRKARHDLLIEPRIEHQQG